MKNRSLLWLLLICISVKLEAQQYCMPQMEYGNTGNHIFNFIFHTLENRKSETNDKSYIYYLKNEYTTHLNIGERYPMIITNRYQSGEVQRFVVWIDYDNNQKFDVLEKVVDYIGTEVYAYIDIPNNIDYLGERGVRVMALPVNSAVDPCGVYYTKVEAEDYTITITEAGPHEKTTFVPIFSSPGSGMNINNFSLHTLKNFGSLNNNAGYVFYNDTNLFYTKLYKGSTYKGFVGKELLVGPLVEYSVWMDMDMNDSFEQEEKLFQSPGVWSTEFSITIPDTISSNRSIRMRVLASTDGEDIPYYHHLHGEAEDYWVYLSTDKPTGIENTALQNISVYPNPFTDEITINGLDGEEISATLINPLGQKVFKTEIVTNSTLNTEGLPAGVYILQIEDKNGFVRSLRVVRE